MLKYPQLILGNCVFSLRTWIMKPQGEPTLPDDKCYSNFRQSRTRPVAEGAFRRLKSSAFQQCRVHFSKCGSHKETRNSYELACFALHNLCIELGDFVPGNLYLTLDYASNKCLSPEEGQQPFSAVLQNRCSQKLRNIHRKASVLVCLFKKVTGLQACKFIKKGPQHSCFPVNIANFLRAASFIEHLRYY